MPAEAAGGQAAAPTVLYVTGWCRNGSTLLGNLLGEVDGVFHAGELRFLWLNGVLGEGSNRRCGCGEDLVRCPLWAGVLSDVQPPGRALERHAHDIVGWQASCRTRHTGRVLRHPPHNGWPGALAATYRSIAARTGSSVVVDTSKFASDAALLRHLEGISPVCLHLVRDPRGAALSWLRPKDYTGRRGVVDSTWHWLGFNLAGEAVRRTAEGGGLHLRYEDLVADPAGALAPIMARIGRGGSPPPVGADGTAELGPNHTVTGNPDRFRRGPVPIREDRRARGELAPAQWAATTLLASPLLGRYGYSWRR